MAFPSLAHIPLETLQKQMYSVWFQSVDPGPLPLSKENQERQLGVGTRELRDAMDHICRINFEPYLAAISPTNLTITLPESYAEELKWGELAAPLLVSSNVWQATASQLLSLVVLLDQVPRNIFRKDQKLAYSYYDVLCRTLVRTLFSKGVRPDMSAELQYSMGYRMWFYLPFMHSEYLEDHQAFDKYFSCMRNEIEPKGNENLTAYLDHFRYYEDKHVNILKQFGRYPHRNIHIGRKQTDMETEFLINDDNWFGTKP